MKVAIDCRMIDSSGIGTFLKGVLPFLLNNRNSEWLLIGNEDRLAEYRDNRVSILNCNIPIFSIKELFCFDVNKINKCDAYFSPEYNIPFGIKIPVIATIHDVIFFDVKGLTSKIGTFLRKLYIALAIKKSDALITVSKFSASRIKHHFPYAKNLDICYNGANSNLINAKEIENEYNITSPYFLFVGNIKKHKGLDILIDSFQEMPESFKLVVVGNKDAFRTSDSKTSQLLKTLSSSSRIVFTGKISDGALKSLIINARALIQPSRYEGFGIPPLEAMLLNTPAIVSDIEVFREIYSDFPVVYFKQDNSHDLALKMKTLTYDRVQLSESLRNHYSYKKSAEIIWNKIIDQIQQRMLK